MQTTPWSRWALLSGGGSMNGTKKMKKRTESTVVRAKRCFFQLQGFDSTIRLLMAVYPTSMDMDARSGILYPGAHQIERDLVGCEMVLPRAVKNCGEPPRPRSGARVPEVPNRATAETAGSQRLRDTPHDAMML